MAKDPLGEWATNPAAPGYTTTEFWSTMFVHVLTAASFIAAGFGVKFDGSSLSPIIPAIAFLASAIAQAMYSHSRSNVKQAILAGLGAAQAGVTHYLPPTDASLSASGTYGDIGDTGELPPDVGTVGLSVVLVVIVVGAILLALGWVGLGSVLLWLGVVLLVVGVVIALLASIAGRRAAR